jgi:hypothetical protein
MMQAGMRGKKADRGTGWRERKGGRQGRQACEGIRQVKMMQAGMRGKKADRGTGWRERKGGRQGRQACEEIRQVGCQDVVIGKQACRAS